MHSEEWKTIKEALMASYHYLEVDNLDDIILNRLNLKEQVKEALNFIGIDEV